jgi:hypothetical protein
LRRRAERALAELGAGAPLVAVGLLVLNYQRWKSQFHNALTGKLSDVAICFLLPLLVSAALGLVRDWSGRRRLAVGAVVATLAFTLLELSDMAGALFVRATRALGMGGGTLTRDPTDLLALACVPLAVAYGRRRLMVADRGPSVWRSVVGALVMMTGSLALMADSDLSKTCHEPAVKIQAEAGCGPGGLIAVQASAGGTGFTLSNPGALGLPTFFSSDHCAWSSGQLAGAVSSGAEVQCPLSFDGGEIVVHECLYSNGVVASAPACANCNWVTPQTCSAMLADGKGTFTCQPSDGGASCVSHLTVVLDGGAVGELDGMGGPADAGASASVMDAAATAEVAGAWSEQAVDGSSEVD